MRFRKRPEIARYSTNGVAGTFITEIVMNTIDCINDKPVFIIFNDGGRHNILVSYEKNDNVLR